MAEPKTKKKLSLKKVNSRKVDGGDSPRIAKKGKLVLKKTVKKSVEPLPRTPSIPELIISTPIQVEHVGSDGPTSPQSPLLHKIPSKKGTGSKRVQKLKEKRMTHNRVMPALVLADSPVAVVQPQYTHIERGRGQSMVVNQAATTSAYVDVNVTPNRVDPKILERKRTEEEFKKEQDKKMKKELEATKKRLEEETKEKERLAKLAESKGVEVEQKLESLPITINSEGIISYSEGLQFDKVCEASKRSIALFREVHEFIDSFSIAQQKFAKDMEVLVAKASNALHNLPPPFPFTQCASIEKDVHAVNATALNTVDLVKSISENQLALAQQLQTLCVQTKNAVIFGESKSAPMMKEEKKRIEKMKDQTEKTSKLKKSAEKQLKKLFMVKGKELTSTAYDLAMRFGLPDTDLNLDQALLLRSIYSRKGANQKQAREAVEKYSNQVSNLKHIRRFQREARTGDMNAIQEADYLNLSSVKSLLEKFCEKLTNNCVTDLKHAKEVQKKVLVSDPQRDIQEYINKALELYGLEKPPPAVTYDLVLKLRHMDQLNLEEEKFKLTSVHRSDFEIQKALNSLPKPSLDVVLSDKRCHDALMEWAKLFHCSENLEFYDAVIRYQQRFEDVIAGKGDRIQKKAALMHARKIYNEFCDAESEQKINLNHANFLHVEKAVHCENEEKFNANLYKEPLEEIFELMKTGFIFVPIFRLTPKIFEIKSLFSISIPSTKGLDFLVD